MKALAVLTLCAAAATVCSATSIGTILQRDFGVYKSLPITAEEAISQGWKMEEKLPWKICHHRLGFPAWQDGYSPSERRPITLFFTGAGQVSAISTEFYNHVHKQKQNLISKGYLLKPYFTPEDTGVYTVRVAFRNESDACSSSLSTLPLGDRLVVNPSEGVNEALPLTPALAKAQGWVKGSCFAGMGTHWFRDLSSFGSMTWSAAELLPIVLMFDEESVDATNSINAFFFASPVVQQTYLPPHENQWEPIALPNVLMCKNMCNSSCTFHDTSFYSTMHIYMNPRDRVTCKNGCTQSCCSK